MVINGITVKDPNLGGLVETPEPIWSSDTGRSAKSAKMIGDLVAFKYTVECSWNIMTYQELYTLRNAILSGMNAGNGFFSISYPTTNASGQLTSTTRTVYASSLPATLYSTASNFQRYTDISVTFIEQ